MVSIESGICRPGEFEAVLGCLNGEFIQARGRAEGIEKRFTGLLDDPANFVVRRNGGEILSALAVKRFTWITPDREFKGAMIGMVWTAPQARGKGHAAANLAFARTTFGVEGRDFAVLWTDQPGIYAGSGWIAADSGLYGVAPGRGSEGDAQTPDDPTETRVDALRKRLAPSRILRDTSAGFPVPLPVTHVRAICESDAYAVLGFNGDETFVLDLLGTPESLAALWSTISATGRRIHINIPADGVAARWMAQSMAGVLQPKPLAMWLPLSGRARHLDYSSLYVPFIDRI
jgi:hypothetical protein